MKNFKLPFTDRFGNALHEGDKFKYTAHKGYLLPTFIATIIWIENKAAFGYQKELGQITAFAEHDELKYDFLRHIERIEK